MKVGVIGTKGMTVIWILIILFILEISLMRFTTTNQIGGDNAKNIKKMRDQLAKLNAELAKLQRDSTIKKNKYQENANKKINKIRTQISKLKSTDTKKINKLNDKIQDIQQKALKDGEKSANKYNEKIDKVTDKISELQDKLNEVTEIQTKNDMDILNVKTDISDPYKHLRMWKIIDWLRSFWLTR